MSSISLRTMNVPFSPGAFGTKRSRAGSGSRMTAVPEGYQGLPSGRCRMVGIQRIIDANRSIIPLQRLIPTIFAIEPSTPFLLIRGFY